MAKQTLQQIKRLLVGKNIFFFKLLDPFPNVGFVAGIDTGHIAVNIAMAYRHLKFKEPAGTITQFNTVMSQTSTLPMQRNTLPPGGIVLGGGTQDSFWSANQIRQVAASQGYKRSELIEAVSFDKLKDLVSQQFAPIVAIDVNAQGDPGYYGGANAQWSVILGFAIFKDGGKAIVATHSWGGFYLWNIDDVVQSNIQLLALPAQTAQKQVVNSPSNPVSVNTAAVSLNAVRNKLVVIRV